MNKTVPKAKMYQIKARGHSKLKSVEVGGKKMNFVRKVFHTPDQRLAQDIQDKYPRDVMSIPNDSWTDGNGHRYSWSLRHLGDWKSRIDWGHK